MNDLDAVRTAWKKRVGNRVRVVRKDAQLTQKQFADRIGLKEGMIGKIERGISPLTGDIALRIEQQFGVAVAALYADVTLPADALEVLIGLRQLSPRDRLILRKILQFLRDMPGDHPC